MAAPVPDIPHVPWEKFWPMFVKRYGQADRDNAEHVTILGPTGTGKSTLAMAVADRRYHVVQFVEKPRDRKLLGALKHRRYRKVDELPDGAGYPKVYLWPPAGDVTDQPEQARQFRAALRTAGRVGVWHVVVHEAAYLVDPLGLGPELKQVLRMGRSNGTGLILCSQRPAWLPRDIYSQASHLFLFGTNDSADLRAIGGLNGMNEKAVREKVAGLHELGDSHVFLYVGTRDGTLVTSRAPGGL